MSEPTVTELAVAIAKLEATTEERDRRYSDLRAADSIAIAAALSSADRAVLKAEGAADKRFDSVNEFRKTLGDQAALFMPRGEAEVRLAFLEKQLHTTRGRGEGLKDVWGYAIGALGLLAATGGILVAVLK